MDMENYQQNQVADITTESKYYSSKENFNDSQANEESESNLKPLNMFQEDEDQEEEEKFQEDNDNDDEYDDEKIIQRSENSFNERLSDYELDANEHFASVYNDSNLNESQDDYNDRDLNNNSYLNSVLHISQAKQATDFNTNQNQLLNSEDSFLKDVIRESEELQKQLRYLDNYLNQNKSQNQQDDDIQQNQVQQQIQGLNSVAQKIDSNGDNQQNKRQIIRQNKTNEAPKHGLKKSDSKSKLTQGKKQQKCSNTEALKKQTTKSSSQKKELKTASFSDNKNHIENNKFDNRNIQTEPFQSTERNVQKRKKCQHSIHENKKIKSRNTSTSQPRSQSKGRPKSKSITAETAQTASEKSNKNKKMIPKSKESSANSKKQINQTQQIQENQHSKGDQSDQKQHYQMNPLLMISDFDENLKNSYSEQIVINMLQQFMIKNDINSSYAVNAQNEENQNYINQNNNQQDYQNVSNISTNHQFFHNEYLQDQVPNLENESEFFDQREGFNHEVSDNYQHSSYSQFSHVCDSDEENKYSTHLNSNYDSQQNRTDQHVDNYNSTGDFQQKYLNQNNNNKNNLYEVNYQNNNRLNNYFTESDQQKAKTNYASKQIDQTEFTFNSTRGEERNTNTQANKSTQNNTPKNRDEFVNKLLISSSSARLRNGDSNSLWDLSQDNESIFKDNQMKVDDLKISQKIIEKKATKKTKTNSTLNTQTKVSKQPKKKKDVKKKISGSQHSIKELKSSQTTQRKTKETINSKTSLNNFQSEKNFETEANYYSTTSNEQNIVQQLEKQLQEKDTLIELLRQQNNSLKQKLLNTQKQKREQAHSSATNYSQQQQQNGIIEQLSIAKRLQETNKVLIDRIKELDAKKQQQAVIIENKNEQFKILKQKYSELNKAYKSKVKKNNDLKKENELIKQIKSQIAPQNIDYTQLVQALAFASQNSEFKDPFTNRERDDVSRGTFYTQRGSALGDYGDNLMSNQQNNVQKTQQDQQFKKKATNNNAINETNNYYNQSIQNIQQSNKSVNTNSHSSVSQKKKTTVLNNKKTIIQTIKTPKQEKNKQNK